MPRRIIASSISQKIPNPIALSPGIVASEGTAAEISDTIASPPIHVWMPNHPHATIARRTAGTFAPLTPNAARHSTGNEIPYFVPACAFRIIGTRTTLLPARMVTSACHHVMPCCIRPDASVYVVMTTLMPIQSEAMWYVVHVRRASGVGARSGFQSGLPERSSLISTKSRRLSLNIGRMITRTNVAVAILIAAAAVCVDAQAVNGPVPRLNGKPDLSGVWQAERTPLRE